MKLTKKQIEHIAKIIRENVIPDKHSMGTYIVLSGNITAAKAIARYLSIKKKKR